jgi:SAM-dependent methyltransferase
MVRWFWSGYAAVYDWLWASPISDRLAGIVTEQVGPAPGIVLDAGTGTGMMTAGLCARGHTVIGIDASHAMLTRAARRPGSWVVADVARAPFGHGSVNTVIAGNLLHLCPDPSAVLQVLAALLRPGGRLIVCWPCDEVGPWRIAKAELAHHARIGVVARLAVRLMVAMLALVTGSVRRNPAEQILDAVRATACEHNLAQTHELVLDGLQHLIVLDRENRPQRAARCAQDRRSATAADVEQRSGHIGRLIREQP